MKQEKIIMRINRDLKNEFKNKCKLINIPMGFVMGLLIESWVRGKISFKIEVKGLDNLKKLP
jgi:antitoxin component of RelBE/YafQ-DinJ toxin-antitoxin module